MNIDHLTFECKTGNNSVITTTVTFRTVMPTLAVGFLWRTNEHGEQENMIFYLKKFPNEEMNFAFN